MTTPLDLPAIVVDADYVRAHLTDLVLCDVRWYLDGRDGRSAFGEGHLPGAIFVDLDTDLSGPAEGASGRHPFPTPSEFAQSLGALGIGDDDIVIAYDDLGGGTAGRLVWMLRSIGQQAAVLSGGISAWPGPLDTDAQSSRAPAARTTKTWPASVEVNADELGQLGGNQRLLDARSEERFDGRSEPTNAPAGHIPGASSMPYTDLLDADGRYREPSELREIFARRDVHSATPVIASCGSGVSACAVLVGLEYAGLGTGRLFVPSWSGWTAGGGTVEVSAASTS